MANDTICQLTYRVTMLKLPKLNLKDEQVEKTLSVILRVPGLFLLDHWCQSSYTELWSLDSQDIISAVISPLILIQSLLLLLLPLEDLVTLYMHYLSVGLIAGAEFISRHYVLAERQSDKSNHVFFSLFTFGEEKTVSPLILNHFTAIGVHVIVATIVSFLMDVECSVKKAVLAVYAVPVAAKLAHFPLHYLEILHNFSSALIILSILYYSLTSLPSFLLHVYKIYKSVAYALCHEGPLNAAFGVWDWFFIMQQFLVFWCILVAAKLHNFQHHQNPPPGRLVVSPIGHGEWYLLVLYALSDVCTSPVSLLGCSITVMYTSRMILTMTKIIAQGTSVLQSGHEPSRTGITEGVTMTLLAVQTGLIELPMPQRMGAMCIILFIVVGSLVQSMHEIVEPILLALSASHSCSILRHIRVVAVSLFLLVFPLYMSVFLCRLFDVDFWTLVVISTCTLTSIQVLGALTIYGLFVYDALQKDSEWEDLDDIIYYTRALIRVLEFLVAVLVVGAGVRESIFLSSEGRPWSLLNSSVLAVHCYYNVYLRLQSGWHSFLLRREAAHKIHSLPSANADQLESHSHDVCAICHVKMKTACVTPCNHLFHAACLKKWFYIQDRCPLCSTHITGSETSEHNKASDRATLVSDDVTENENTVDLHSNREVDTDVS